MMGNYEMLKAAIEAVIKENGNGEITGEIMQRTLLAIVGSLGEGAQFAGIADSSTEPGEKDMKLFYIAGPGDYANFGGTHVPEGSIAVFPNVGDSWEGKVIRVLTIDEELSSDSTNPVQNKAVKKAIDAVSKAAESWGSVATTGLLQLLLEHPDEPYTLTEEEVQSVFGGIENFRKAVSGPLAIKDVFSQDGQSATFLLQPIYSTTGDKFAGFWVMDETSILLGLKSNYITMMEQNGAVSISYVNDTGPDGGLLYELPGSIYSITDESTPEELEAILGDFAELKSAIKERKLIVSAGYHTTDNFGGASSRDYAPIVVEAEFFFGGNTNPTYSILFRTPDRNIDISLASSSGSYTSARVETLSTASNSVVGAINELKEDIDDAAENISGKQDRTDQSLKTTDKTVAGAINEVYDSLGDIDTILDEINGEDAI